MGIYSGKVYNSYRAYKLWPGKGASQTAEYGEICVASDVVGVLLEFDNNDASVTFFKNKVYIYSEMLRPSIYQDAHAAVFSFCEPLL